ncbi:MAG: EAL domain-containing protein [Gammaproteobacteria bacterium]|nr:EAL domain-containing protein [Gammaproteobacteria bacterium]
MSRRLLPQGFQGKLLLAFTGLLSVTVLCVGVAVSITSSQKVLNQMREKALVGSHVLDSFLRSRREQLESAVAVLTNDYGFRSAVASNDEATIASALANHGQRVQADLVVLVNTAGRTLAAAGATAVDDMPFQAALQRARTEGSAAATAAYRGNLYQFFVVPVLAPEPIAWVVVAFAIDHSIALELAELTDLAVTFTALDKNDSVAAAVSTLPVADHRALLPTLVNYRAERDGRILYTNEQTYLSAVRALNSDGDTRIFAVLQKPTRVISETIWLVIGQTTAILSAALALALTLSIYLARRMSNPVQRLISAARKIEQGDYTTPVRVEDGGEMALLGSALNTMQDGIREREARIRYQADYDDLTDLPNLRRLQREYSNQPAPFTLCLLAVADLKDVSFSFGYDISNALLAALAKRLSGIPGVREVARVSGNEFAVVLPPMSPEEALIQARAMRDRAAETYAIGNHTVTCRCCAAVIAYPRDAGDFLTLYRGVETTLEAANETADGCMGYLPGREESRARQLDIIASFEDACAGDQLSVFYQPKIDLASNRVVEGEALLRWQHPRLGFIPPDEFILLAERSGNIRLLTDWMLNAAISQVARWQKAGMDMCVSINLSAHDLADANLHRIIDRIMQHYGVDGSRLVMEITESAIMRDRDRACQALERLKALGIRLSIDDFGTGQSSLAQLKQLPVDELKIDKSFVLELDRSADDALIVSSTIDLAHNLGLRVVAEGVENAASLSLLMNYDCDKAQGYFFSKPLPAEAFQAWVTQANAGGQSLREATGP